MRCANKVDQSVRYRRLTGSVGKVVCNRTPTPGRDDHRIRPVWRTGNMLMTEMPRCEAILFARILILLLCYCPSIGRWSSTFGTMALSINSTAGIVNPIRHGNRRR